MKVLHLAYGGQMTTLCPALREIGIDATSCHLRKSKLDFNPDICLNLQEVPESEVYQKRKEFLDEAVKIYDTFHFHWGETFFPDKSDLEYLKSLGKKMVVHHRGSEVRRLSISHASGNLWARVKTSLTEEQKIANLEKLSQYIDHAIVADHELLSYIKGYYKHIHIIRNAVKLDKFTPNYPTKDKDRPIIVHSPTQTYTKGSEFVIAAIKKLGKKGYNFKFIPPQNKIPYEKMQKIYKHADIIVDQLREGVFGVTSLEGMAQGKPVICHIREDLVQTFPSDLPIFNANPDTIYSALEKLITSPELRFELGVKGRKYIEKHHDSRVIAQQIGEVYKKI
ncbi:glycosyltransferase family 4 protein (plasmid) [Priestia aryabhattai]|uniref:glycosyltransferase family 4 protein n=1 Tax=Priestia aryabhattai TaxID=412384 RepID=UPI0035AB9910